jgi:hypothetical protein
MLCIWGYDVRWCLVAQLFELPNNPRLARRFLAIAPFLADITQDSSSSQYTVISARIL